MSFRGLVPIFTTVRSRVSLPGDRDKPEEVDDLRTYLRSRKEEFLKEVSAQDNLASLFEYELYRAIFDFLIEFVGRDITDPESSDSATLSHSDKDLREDLVGDDDDDTSDLNDPVDSLSNDGKGLTDQEGEEEEEEEEDEEEEMEDETEDDDKGDLLSRHLVTDALLLDSTLQPI